jgi:transcriptional regulator with XRE-family HTH domain
MSTKPTMASPPRSAQVRVPAQARWAKRVGPGTRLRHARLQAGMTLFDVARDLTTTAYLSRIEAGERRPSQALLADLGQRLGLDIADLTGGESRAATGLCFELAHAELLLASGHAEDASWVSSDLIEIATGIGALDVAQAARVIHANALAAAGHTQAALRAVLPLTNGSSGLAALVTQARLHLELGRPQRAVDIGRRVAEQIAGASHQLSLPESADLALTLCEAYGAIGRGNAAAQIARLTLRHLPAAAELRPAEQASSGMSPLAVSYRSFDDAVRKIEAAVAELQETKLHADIELLQAYGPPTSNRDALPSYVSGQAAVS